jgi:hypothetical protein
MPPVAAAGASTMSPMQFVGTPGTNILKTDMRNPMGIRKRVCTSPCNYITICLMKLLFFPGCMCAVLKESANSYYVSVRSFLGSLERWLRLLTCFATELYFVFYGSCFSLKMSGTVLLHPNLSVMHTKFTVMAFSFIAN